MVLRASNTAATTFRHGKTLVSVDERRHPLLFPCYRAKEEERCIVSTRARSSACRMNSVSHRCTEVSELSELLNRLKPLHRAQRVVLTRLTVPNRCMELSLSSKLLEKSQTIALSSACRLYSLNSRRPLHEVQRLNFLKRPCESSTCCQCSMHRPRVPHFRTELSVSYRCTEPRESPELLEPSQAVAPSSA